MRFAEPSHPSRCARCSSLVSRRDCELGIGQHALRAFREFLIAHRPARDLDVGKADIDPLALVGIVRFQRAVDAVVVVGRAFPIAAIERDDEIRLLEDRPCSAGSRADARSGNSAATCTSKHRRRRWSRRAPPCRPCRLRRGRHIAAAAPATRRRRACRRSSTSAVMSGAILPGTFGVFGSGSLTVFGELRLPEARRRSTCRSGLAARSS